MVVVLVVLLLSSLVEGGTQLLAAVVLLLPLLPPVKMVGFGIETGLEDWTLNGVAAVLEPECDS